MAGYRRPATLAALALIVCAACGGPKLKKIANGFYVDEVEPGKPSPRLYWMRDGKRMVVDRQIIDYATPGCVIYETIRPSLSRVVFAVLPEKSPAPIVASDAMRPWRMSFDGLRRFEIPKAQEDGRTILAMDYVPQSDICMLAFNQPPFAEDWNDRTPLNFSRVSIERTEFDVNGADSVGNSTLSLEIQKRHRDVMEELLRAGADPNAANQSGGTPLMTAIAFDRDSTVMIERLLDAGAEIDAQDDRGETALMAAAQYTRKDAVQLLLARGANPAIHDNLGRTASALTGNSPEAQEIARLLDEAVKRRHEGRQ